MSGEDTTRWVDCPSCGAPAEMLAVRIYCVRPGCRWFDARAVEAYVDEYQTAVPWQAWDYPPDDGP